MDKIDLIIDALERANELWLTEPMGEKAIAAARELKLELAKPEQEPVRWFQQFGDAPPRKEWVGLTEDEKESVYKHADAENHQLSKVVSAVEWLLKDKNTTHHLQHDK